MRGITSPARHACLTAFLLGTSLLTAPAPEAHAQGTAIESTHAFDIPAGSLAMALNRFADASGVQLVYDSALVQGQSVAALSGRMSADQALRRLLAGTGITFHLGAANTVTLDKPPSGGAMMLDPVTIEGTSRQAEDSAYGPVHGYVAKRSATGTKTDVAIAEVPQSISVITREQMEARAAQTLGDAVRYTPGLLKSQSVDAVDDGMYARGFQINHDSLYVDGLRGQSNIYSTTAEPYALERVEFLRGPASVLYGQSGPAGVLNVVSKRPTATPLHELQVLYGTDNRKQIATDHSGALEEGGAFSYRLTALLRDSDTMIDYVNDDKTYIAPALTWKPNDDTSITVLANYLKADTVYSYGYPFIGSVRAHNNGAVDTGLFVGEPGFDHWDRTAKSVAYVAEHKATSALTLRQSMRYSTFKNDYATTYINSLTSASQTSVTRNAYSRLDKSEQFSLDNNAQFKATTGALEHTFLGGIDYGRGFLDRFQRSGSVAGTFNPFAPVYGNAVSLTSTATDSTTSSEQLGLYAQDHIKIDGKWVVLLGGRQDWATDKTENRLTSLNTTTESSAFTGRAGLVYLSETGLSPYASYAESFQPQTNPNATGPAFQPTTGQQYEAGLKYQPPGMTSSLRLSVYHLTRQNVPTLISGSTYSQVGEVVSEGVEAEAVASLSPGFNLIAGYAFTDAKITQTTNAAELGRKTAVTPKHMASLWADYKIQDGALAGLSSGLGIRYVGETWSTDNSVRAPDYATIDAMLRYDVDEHWGMGLNISNLLDKVYVANCTYACFYGERRTVMGTITYRW